MHGSTVLSSIRVVEIEQRGQKSFCCLRVEDCESGDGVLGGAEAGVLGDGQVATSPTASGLGNTVNSPSGVRGRALAH